MSFPAVVSATATFAWIAASPHVGPSVRLTMLVVAALAFIVAIRSVIDSKTILVVSAVALALSAFLAPPDSGDVYMYSMFGSIAANHGDSPYVHSPREYPDDPLLEPTTEGWRHVRSPYGPAFVALAAGVARIAQHHPRIAAHVFQILAALTVMACVCIVYRRTRDSRIAAFIGMNPAVLAMVNGGHNDIFVAGLLFVAVVIGPRRTIATSALLALAICIKVTAALPAAAYLAYLLFHPSDNKKNGRSVLVMTLAASAITYAAVGIPNVISSLGDSDMVTSRASLWSFAKYAIGKTGMYVFIVGAALVICAVGGKSRERLTTPAIAVAIAAVAEVFLLPYVLPWYAASSVFLAAITANSRLMIVAQAQAMALLFAYVVAPGEAASGISAVLSAVSLPVAAMIAIAIFFRSDKVQARKTSRSAQHSGTFGA